MNNIFNNAYFGKPFKTRDGRKAVFYNHHNGYAREKANYVTMILEGQESIYRWYYDGTAWDSQEQIDIISEWQEEINEDELDKLGNEYIKSLEGKSFNYIPIKDSFKDGYRKAMEK